MAKEPTSSGSEPLVGSATWQAPAEGQDRARPAAYLERVTATAELQEIASRSLAGLDLKPNQRVLEVGCGTGVFLPLLARAVGPGGHVVGIDHAPDFVDQARQRVVNLGLADVVAVEQADIYRLPFPDASFDAAHCERVLMHLDDPTAALREMRRVVVPGGRIVAAETDWRGARLDHPDSDGLNLLLDRWMTGTRNPLMGLELNRRFAEAGLIQRVVTPVTFGGTDYAALVMFGFDLAIPAEALVAEGCMTRDHVDRILDHLAAASQDGSFFTYGTIVVAMGRVPST